MAKPTKKNSKKLPRGKSLTSQKTLSLTMNHNESLLRS